MTVKRREISEYDELRRGFSELALSQSEFYGRVYKEVTDMKERSARWDERLESLAQRFVSVIDHQSDEIAKLAKATQILVLESERSRERGRLMKLLASATVAVAATVLGVLEYLK